MEEEPCILDRPSIVFVLGKNTNFVLVRVEAYQYPRDYQDTFQGLWRCRVVPVGGTGDKDVSSRSQQVRSLVLGQRRVGHVPEDRHDFFKLINMGSCISVSAVTVPAFPHRFLFFIYKPRNAAMPIFQRRVLSFQCCLYRSAVSLRGCRPGVKSLTRRE